MNEWLLDTGVLLWWLVADPRLSFIVRTRITQAETRVFVSVATAWEVASLARQGRVDLGESPEVCLPRQIALHRFLWLPLDARHVLRASALPRGTLDPYDRLLVAQAALEGLSIVSTDPRLGGHGVPIVEAMELPRLLEGRALGSLQRQPGQPCPRPVRRSGDDLEGEAHADPTALRRIDNPSGAIDGPPRALGGLTGLIGGTPGAPDGPLGALGGPTGLTGGLPGAPDGPPGALVGPKGLTGGLPGAPDGPPGALGGGDEGPADEPGTGGAGTRWRTDYGERAGVETGGFAEEHEGGAEPDPVVLRPIPRWNAFPWGGVSRSDEDDE